MSLLNLLAASTATPGHLNPVKLFLDADIVVQAVMTGLVLASVWVWMIIISFSLRIGSIRRASRAWEQDFWSRADNASLGDLRNTASNPSARIAAAATRPAGACPAAPATLRCRSPPAPAAASAASATAPAPAPPA